jgi:hypothetical protein
MKKSTIFVLFAPLCLIATANAQIFCPDVIDCIKSNGVGDVSCAMKPYTGHWSLDWSSHPTFRSGVYKFVQAIHINQSGICFFKVNPWDSDAEAWKTYSTVNLSKSGPNWVQKGPISTCDASVKGCAFVQMPTQ